MAPSLPDDVNIPSDDSQLALLLSKTAQTAIDKLMSSPTQGPYQKLPSKPDSPLPASSPPAPIQKSISGRSGKHFHFMPNALLKYVFSFLLHETGGGHINPSPREANQ